MVDLTFLRQFTKGDKSKMQRYVRMYLDTAPQTLQQMKLSLRSQNWEQLRIQAHSLKPQAEFMGIGELKTVLMAIENDARSGAADKLSQLYERARRLHEQSVPHLQRLL